MNVNSFIKGDYRKNDAFAVQKNKANSKPIAERVKLMQCVYLQRIMKKNSDRSYKKTKPKQTQFKSEDRGQMSVFCLLSSVLCSRMSEITCLCHLQFMAHSGTMTPVKEVRVSLTEMPDQKFQLNAISGVKKV